MSQPPAWRSPMFVLVAGSLAILVGMGIRSAFGIFQRPMIQDLGWSREAFGFAIALQQLIWGLAQPVLGGIADRYGSGRVLAGSAILYAAGVWLMGHGGDSLLIFNLSAGVMVGIGIAGAGMGTAMAAIARAWPPDKRSLVFGIGTAAGSMGQFLLNPIGNAIQLDQGWSMALTVFAVLALVIVPLSIPLQGRPQIETGPQQSIAAALKEAMAHRGFVFLAAGYFVCGFQIAFMTTHFPAYLVDEGLAPEIAGFAMATVGAFNIVGSLTAGVLGQKRRKKYLLAWIYLLRAIGVTAFMLLPLTGASALIFSAFMGLLWLSTVPLTTGLVGQIFGLRYLAMLSGLVFLAHQIGSFIGVWAGGLLYDRTGSYDIVWWLGVLLALAAAAINLPIDDRTVRREVVTAA
jgi:MFS family permease